MKTKQDLESMSSADLRAEVRKERDLGNPNCAQLTGTQIVGMSKVECISAILGLGAEQPEQHKQAEKPEKPASTNNNKALAEQLANILNNANNPVDMTEIEKMIDNKMDSAVRKIREDNIQQIEIKRQDDSKEKIDTPHIMFRRLLDICQLRLNAFLSGPAGSGKTTGAHQVAKALDLPYYPISVCSQTTISHLMGYTDATGKYVETGVYKAFVNGGVLLIDEVDGGNANVTNVLNALLANGTASFPCGTFEKHPDFICISAGNTWGYGASREYCGRNPLDGAFLDRWIPIPWDYDEKLERKIAGNLEWTEYVQKIRKTVFDLKIKIIVSPRASIAGAKLIKAGWKKEDVENYTIWNKVGDEIRQKVKKAMEA